MCVGYVLIVWSSTSVLVIRYGAGVTFSFSRDWIGWYDRHPKIAEKFSLSFKRANLCDGYVITQVYNPNIES